MMGGGRGLPGDFSGRRANATLRPSLLAYLVRSGLGNQAQVGNIDRLADGRFVRGVKNDVERDVLEDFVQPELVRVEHHGAAENSRGDLGTGTELRFTPGVRTIRQQCLPLAGNWVNVVGHNGWQSTSRQCAKDLAIYRSISSSLRCFEYVTTKEGASCFVSFEDGIQVFITGSENYDQLIFTYRIKEFMHARRLYIESDSLLNGILSLAIDVSFQ